MDLIEFLRFRYGSARTADLKRAGFSERALAAAVGTGLIERVQRGVYVAQEADPDVVAAFRANAILTCIISAARFYGLWILREPAGLHLSCGKRRGCRMHVQLKGVGEVDCLINDCLVIELDGGTHWKESR